MVYRWIKLFFEILNFFWRYVYLKYELIWLKFMNTASPPSTNGLKGQWQCSGVFVFHIQEMPASLLTLPFPSLLFSLWKRLGISPSQIGARTLKWFFKMKKVSFKSSCWFSLTLFPTSPLLLTHSPQITKIPSPTRTPAPAPAYFSQGKRSHELKQKSWCF